MERSFLFVLGGVCVPSTGEAVAWLMDSESANLCVCVCAHVLNTMSSCCLYELPVIACLLTENTL